MNQGSWYSIKDKKNNKRNNLLVQFGRASVRKFCDKGGKEWASVSYGHNSSF